MRQLLRPLTASSTYRAWAHALIGAAAAFPMELAAVAALAALRPGPASQVLLGVATVAAIGGLGLPLMARRSSIRLANALLDTGLLRPTVPRRFATAAWFVAWTAGGGGLMLASLLALFSPTLVVVWLSGGDTVTVFAPVEIHSGIKGAWTLPAVALCLLSLPYLTAAHAWVMRRIAVRLLGPSLTERLAAAEAEADRVAARNRLARELHDSIGHTLTASTIQAAVAKQLLDSDPTAARFAMTAIEDASRAALDDLDRALGILRDEPEPSTARPTLTDLAALRDRLLKGGNDIALTCNGDPATVTPAVSREAYRIAQEGITNALRHAPGSPIHVQIDLSPTHLDLAVRNPFPAPLAPTSPGRGLTGISERARLLGGTATAGPEDPTTWRLHASLPLHQRGDPHGTAGRNIL